MWKYLNICKKNKKSKRDIIEISFKEIKKDECILIDVRSKKEYLEGHLPGAINIPLSNIRKGIKNIEQENKKIVLYCQSGARSKKAAKILEDMQYQEIYNLTGGIENI